MSDNALTVIHWTRYDGTAQTRPHSVKDVFPLPAQALRKRKPWKPLTCSFLPVRSISNRRHFNCCPKKIITRTPRTA